MNLDNYKSVALTIVKNNKNEGTIYLATDDHKAAAKVAEAYNQITMLQNKDDFFYCTNIIAYLK